jgi:type IV secretion system protein TrbL
VASGLGNVASTGAQAAASPLKRAASKAAESLKSSYQTGARAAFETAGGSSTAGSIGGEAAGADAAASPASSSSAANGPPAWAKRMKRNQQMTHGVQAAAHAVKSGDSHGGGSSVNLSESD